VTRRIPLLARGGSALAAALIVLAALLATSGTAAAEGPALVYFPATGHHVGDAYLTTWRAHGGLAAFGYPLTEVIERDGMQVQYFERARFEHHPDQAGTEYEIQFTLLGSWLAAGRTEPAFTPFPPDTPETTPDHTFFPETGHFLGYGFRAYWQAQGGLRIFGYPISEEFSEGGFTVQYFERARFEWHPENAGTEYEILLGRLGADRAAAEGIDMAPAPRIDGVPDYDESLWAPPPPPPPPPTPSEPRALRIPVLMYHRFGEPAERYQVPYWRFEQQLDWLAANGYSTVTLAEVYDYMAGVGELPAQPVVITLDDGFISQWEAGQALAARGMRGAFFVTTGQPHLADWQIAELASAGHEIGAHTVAHADLTTLSDDQLWRELTAARWELQAASGQAVDFLAYPNGTWDARVIASAQAAGYRGAVAAWGGSWWSPESWWHEPRIEVSGYLTLDEFAAVVLYGGSFEYRSRALE
jgi:peptidoglycan/xylan/chitin deacetylase (PgdA/CDA1 family)